jgi:hypothetical protein
MGAATSIIYRKVIIILRDRLYVYVSVNDSALSNGKVYRTAASERDMITFVVTGNY